MRILSRKLGLSVAALVLGVVASAANAAEVKVVAIQALTGPYAFAGAPSREGIEIALEQIEKGNPAGENTINLTIQDTASEKQQGISLFTQTARDPSVMLIIGPSASIEGVAVAPIANEQQIPMLTTTAVADAIGEAGIWSFRTPASPSVIIGDIGGYAAETLGVKRAALVFARDNDGAIAQAKVARAAFEAAGVEVAAEETVLAADTDFSAQVTKLQSMGIDGVFFAIPSEQSANFVIQARQAGIGEEMKFMGTPAMGSGRFIEVGGGAVEGATFVADYFAGNTTPENVAFVEAFRAKHDRDPDALAALGYTAMMVAAEAIKHAGDTPSRDSIRQALTDIKEMPVVLGRGKFEFGETRSPSYGALVLTVKDGKFALAE